MASRQLAKTESAHAGRMADVQKAAELAERFNGWAVFSSRNGRTRVATRTGNQTGPDDGVWAASIIADDWDDLEEQLAVQAQHDAMRTYGVGA
jgi:hypothetical protein